MYELIAAGPMSDQAWRRPLPADEVTRLGRAPRQGLVVPWDALISREHANLTIAGDRVVVEKLETAKSPILQRGRPSVRVELRPGDSFVIGQTTFTVVLAERTAILHSRIITRKESEAVAFASAHERLELLSRLPDLLARSRRPEELTKGIVDMLLAGVAPAAAAAVVQEPDEQFPMGVLHARTRRPDQPFNPSRGLIRECLAEQQTRIHVWNSAVADSMEFTMSKGLDWAVCTPIRSQTRTAWGLYIAGSNQRLSSIQAERLEHSLLPEVRFVELLCRFLGAVYDLRTTERRRATLSQFFSPSVVAVLTDAADADKLAPSPQQVTTIFCDLRGFSRAAEQAASLGDLLDSVTNALGLVTQEILRQEGAIADFHGDSVLGFWGWPDADVDGPSAACRAALSILESFERVRRERGVDQPAFRIGIGIAHGQALAGRVGTKEQSKVGVFGPVVNLGSRLEGLTSAWGETILLNEVAAEQARAALSPEEGTFRRLGRFRLYGMDQPTVIYELLSNEAARQRFTDETLAAFRDSVAALEGGDWANARARLQPLAAKDAVSRALLAFLGEHASPSADWDGDIPIAFKRVEPGGPGG